MQSNPQTPITARTRGAITVTDLLVIIGITGGVLIGAITRMSTGFAIGGSFIAIAIALGMTTRKKEQYQTYKTPAEVRLETLRRAGGIALLTAILLALSTYIQLITINYPAILTAQGALAVPMIMQESLAMKLASGGLLLSGVLLFIAARALIYHHPVASSSSSRFLWMTGNGAGVVYVISVFVWVVLVNGTHELHDIHWAMQEYPSWAHVILVLYGIVTPLLLAIWTVLICQNMFRAQRILSILGIVGAAGLVLVLLNSLLWLFNVAVPVGALPVPLLLGEALWLFWLLLFGFWLLNRRESIEVAAQ